MAATVVFETEPLRWVVQVGATQETPVGVVN